MKTIKTIKSDNMSLKRMILALSVLILANTSQAYITVGPANDGNCDYHSLSTAVSSVPNYGSETIRLVGNNNGYQGDGNILMYNRDITIVGGYDSCSDGTSSHLNPSVISASLTGISNISIVGVSQTFETRLTLVSVHVKNGNNDIGGGIKISGNAHVQLNGANVINNIASEKGAGIYIKDGKLTINYNSLISDNDTNQLGGGIYCEDGEVIFFSGDVHNNTADSGGGIFMDNCIMTGTAGNGEKLVRDNHASAGAGLYAQNGSQINMGNTQSLTVFKNNTNPDIEDTLSDGGALFMQNSGTKANFINSHFKDNVNFEGGAVVVRSGAEFNLSSGNSCVTDPDYTGCSSIEHNTARGANDGGTVACNIIGGLGGAVYSQNSKVIIDGVSVRNNIATKEGCIGNDVTIREAQGAAFFAEGGEVTLVDSLVYRNGGNHAKDVISITNAKLNLIQSTLANNKSDVEATIKTRGDSPNTQLWGSIISEGSTDIYDYSSGTNSILISGCNIVSRLSDLNNGGFGTENVVATIQDNPDFVNSANDDYSLNITSQAIDFCGFPMMENTGFSNYFAKDYNGNKRANILSHANYPMDLGAIEYSGGTFSGQSDLALLVTGDTLSALNGNIRYEYTVQNLGDYSAQEPELIIQLDENTGSGWIDIVPENPQDWQCTPPGRTIYCDVTGSFYVHRNVSKLTVNVSADVTDTSVLMSAIITDAKTLDPDTRNNERYLITQLTGVNDIIFQNGFDD